MLFSYVGGQQRFSDNKKCRQIACDFDFHHWMPPLGECLRSIAPAATMVNKFVENTLNTNKTQRLTSNYGTFRALVISEKFIPPNRPSTQLIDATSFVPM